MTAVSVVYDFFHAIAEYREYLKQSVMRDLRKKYKRSSLGYVWSMLNPLLMMTILAVVFSTLMKGKVENYPVFLFCGIIPWGYFNGTIRSCLGTIRQNAKIIDQVPVPKFIFAVSSAIYNLVDLCLSMVPLIIIMIFTNWPIKASVLYFPMVMIPLLMMTMGVSLLVAVSNVFFEDTQHLSEVILRAVYFLCPILFPKEMLPEWLVKWIVINPMFGIIENFRAIFYGGTAPNFELYFINLLGATVFLMFGLLVFKKADNKFIYFV